MESRPAGRTTNRPLVLLVDDDLDTREMYVAGLSFLGCHVIAAPDGARALQQACQRHPDIIVADVVMPRLDGWTLIDHLRRDERTSSIPVVVLTGLVTTSLTARARHEGCAALLLKPCLPETLLAEIRRVLALRSSSGPSSS